MHRPTTPCTFTINPRTPFTCDGRVGGNGHLRSAHSFELCALVLPSDVLRHVLKIATPGRPEHLHPHIWRATEMRVAEMRMAALVYHALRAHIVAIPTWTVGHTT